MKAAFLAIVLVLIRSNAALANTDPAAIEGYGPEINFRFFEFDDYRDGEIPTATLEISMYKDIPHVTVAYADDSSPGYRHSGTSPVRGLSFNPKNHQIVFEGEVTDERGGTLHEKVVCGHFVTGFWGDQSFYSTGKCIALSRMNRAGDGINTYFAIVKSTN